MKIPVRGGPDDTCQGARGFTPRANNFFSAQAELRAEIFGSNICEKLLILVFIRTYCAVPVTIFLFYLYLHLPFAIDWHHTYPWWTTPPGTQGSSVCWTNWERTFVAVKQPGPCQNQSCLWLQLWILRQLMWHQVASYVLVTLRQWYNNPCATRKVLKVSDFGAQWALHCLCKQTN